jgi:hypothetical protein
MLTIRLWLASFAVGLFLIGAAQSASAAALERAPYLQTPTSASMVVKWRTDVATDSVVNYGNGPTNLTSSASSAALTTEHEVTITGLDPDTLYYYSVGSSGQTLSGGDAGHFFTTAPVPGTATPTRIWVIGDSGTANASAAAVRDAYKTNTGPATTDLWLMLGDNAYPDGTDSEYQAAVFDTYPELLRKVPLWTTLGNHDGHTADSATQSGAYYDIFSLPTAGEAGGLASGTEAYYSFDYGNIHFVSLESYETDRSPGGAMMTWLENDLAANDKEWVVAFWHHPPYTKGSHNSDTEGRLIDMREIALPILESYGVDLVLSGHSHSYERSHLLDGHYGASSTLTGAMILDNGGGREDSAAGAYDKPAAAPNAGAVYAVAGSSGKTSSGSLDHPAMFFSLQSLGSMILEVDGNRLDAQFIDASGIVDDYFTITKGPDTTAPSINLTEASDASTVTVTFSEKVDAASAENIANYAIDNGVAVSLATLSADERSVVLDTSPLTEGVVHTLTVDNVDDLAGNTIAANSQSQFTFVTLQTKEFQDGVAPTPGYAGTRDAYISENGPDTANGTATTLLVDGDDPSGSTNDKSTLVLWDISDIPGDATVDTAAITINVTNVGSGYEIYQVLNNWQETGVTWNSASAGTPWQSPGADGVLDRGTTVVGVVNGGVTGSLSVVVNQDGLDVVQSWIDGSAPNNGFIIADTSATNGLDFSSREVGAPLDRPKLSVTYSLPSGGPDTQPPDPPVALTADAVTDTTVSLSWQSCGSAPCDDVGVTGYKVYEGGALIGSPLTPSYVHSGLTPDTTYDYEVSSVDAAGNESSGNPTLMVTTDAPPPVPTILVNDVAMSLQSNKKWRFARAEVTVVDGNADPVSGATVSGAWSGLTSSSADLVTDGNGRATFNSGQVPKSATGDFAFAVTDVVGSGYVYDATANVETSDCIDTAGTDCSGDPPDPGPVITMHTSTLVMTAIQARKHWRGEAALLIIDADTLVPVPGATVTGTWAFATPGGSSSALGSTSAVTGSDGIAYVLSPKERAGPGDMFIFSLVGVTKTDGVFDSTGPVEGTAFVPGS